MNRTDYNFTAVKDARIKAGYKTQAEAARLFNVTEKTVSRVETGLNASFELLKEMALAYDANLKDWIYDPSPHQKKLSEKSTSGIDNSTLNVLY